MLRLHKGCDELRQDGWQHRVLNFHISFFWAVTQKLVDPPKNWWESTEKNENIFPNLVVSNWSPGGTEGPPGGNSTHRERVPCGGGQDHGGAETFHLVVSLWLKYERNGSWIFSLWNVLIYIILIYIYIYYVYCIWILCKYVRTDEIYNWYVNSSNPELEVTFFLI